MIATSLNAATINPASPTNGSITQLTAANFGTTAPGSTNGSVSSNPSGCTVTSGTGVKTFGGCVNAVFRITGRNNGSGNSNTMLRVFILSNSTLSNGSGNNTATFSFSSSSVDTEKTINFPSTGGGNKTVDVTVYGTFNVSTTQATGSYSTAGSPYTVAVCTCNPSSSACANDSASYNAANCNVTGL